jgi:hypothetical protein
MRKVFIGGALLLSCACFLSGCDTQYKPPIESAIEYSDFTLITDSKTKIVYIDNTITNSDSYTYHIYTPYYSENGYLCKFDDDKMIEIIPKSYKEGDEDDK